MSGAGNNPANHGITRQPAVMIDEKAACPKRQAAFCMCAGHGAVLAGESPVMDNLPSM